MMRDAFIDSLTPEAFVRHCVGRQLDVQEGFFRSSQRRLKVFRSLPKLSCQDRAEVRELLRSLPYLRRRYFAQKKLAEAAFDGR